MIPDDLRRKLEKLNQGSLRLSPESPAAAQARPKPQVVGIEELIEGEVTASVAGPFYLVTRPLAKLLERGDELASEFRDVWVKGRYALTEDEMKSQWGEIIDADPHRLLFLDIETCGLTATPTFLIGTMHLDGDDRFRLVQIFARDYAEERSGLAHFASMMNDYDYIVTFNGKSFDWPYICDRSIYHGVQITAAQPKHLDLLHESRRRWKEVLPNCKLQTLEYHVSGRRRVGDLPGSMIPDAYHRYVKSGDARQMLDVLHHNALDLITMSELMLFILQGGNMEWD